MYKFKFVDVLKYAFLKTTLTSVLVPITTEFNREGSQQMVGFSIIVGIFSLGILYLLLLAIRRIEFSNIYYSFLLIGLALVINELIGMAIELDTNIFTVIVKGKPWQVAYKVCDIVSVILSSYLCFVLAIRKIWSSSNK